MQSVTLRNYLHLAAALGIPAIGLTLWSWGQLLLCTCGTVHLWVGSIWSSENSQQIADWYTLAHFMHGLAVILMGRLLFKRLSFNALYVIAIASGVGWEIFEHSDFVIRQFRYGTAPPPMKCSAVMFRKTEDQNGYEASQAGRDCHKAAAG